MKNWLNKIFILSIASAVMISCKKDETRAYVSVGAAGTLTATPSTIVLDSSAAVRNTTAITFNWTPADFGYQAAVNYTLQIAKAGTNFANPREVSLNGGLEQKYTHADFNTLAILAGLPPGSNGQLQARVRSVISSKIDTTYSNVITVTVKPYLVLINYPSLWVPGAYQGWNPGAAPKISSKNSNGQYEGFVNFTGTDWNFKLTSDPDWNHTNYGLGTSTVTPTAVTGGTLNTAGSAGNLAIGSAGFWRIKANTTALTWEALKTTWSVIGSAPTASNNWANDVAMTYNPATGLWTVTTTLQAGAFKFRANNDWGVNFGDTGQDLSLDYGGSDIAVAAALAGSRTITLDLRPGNYTYTIQ